MPSPAKPFTFFLLLAALLIWLWADVLAVPCASDGTLALAPAWATAPRLGWRRLPKASDRVPPDLSIQWDDIDDDDDTEGAASALAMSGSHLSPRWLGSVDRQAQPERYDGVPRHPDPITLQRLRT